MNDHSEWRCSFGPAPGNPPPACVENSQARSVTTEKSDLSWTTFSYMNAIRTRTWARQLERVDSEQMHVISWKFCVSKISGQIVTGPSPLRPLPKADPLT